MAIDILKMSLDTTVASPLENRVATAVFLFPSYLLCRTSQDFVHSSRGSYTCLTMRHRTVTLEKDILFNACCSKLCFIFSVHLINIRFLSVPVPVMHGNVSLFGRDMLHPQHPGSDLCPLSYYYDPRIPSLRESVNHIAMRSTLHILDYS